MPAVAALSVLLGFLSWKYIEAPFRQRPGEARPALRWPRPAVAVLTSFCVAMGAWMFAGDGLPFRFSPQVAALSNAYKDAGEFRDCLSRSPPADGGGAGNLCRLGTAAAPVTFLMLGDSHGAALADGVSHLAKSEGLAGVLSVSDACAPLLDFPGNYLPSRARCEKAQRAIPGLLDSLRPARVVLHAAWGGYHRRDPERFERMLAQTLDAFAARNIQVVIVGDTPGARDNVPINLAKEAAFGTRIDLAWSANEVRQREDATERLLREQAAKRSFLYVDVDDRLCDGAGCRLVAGGLPLYWDHSHLTGRGSRWVATLVGPELLGRGTAPPVSGLGLAAAVRAD